MITVKEYENALEIIKKYENQIELEKKCRERFEKEKKEMEIKNCKEHHCLPDGKWTSTYTCQFCGKRL